MLKYSLNFKSFTGESVENKKKSSFALLHVTNFDLNETSKDLWELARFPSEAPGSK